jgi:LuxR family maltose regulon positive regulatory protein
VKVVKSGLLATKLYRPSVPPGRVRRPHLNQRLQEGLESGRQIALVSAPAGFGKTTCISAWLDTLDGWPVAWLSLDPADDDPGRFLAYFVAALQTVDANLGRELEGALHSGQMPPSEVVSTTLLNDILELEGPFLLILDDLQVIQDPFILQMLAKLLANLPDLLYLVLLTREDPPLPLARLRANNQLTEIRANDLRFSRSDAGCLLNEVFGLSLSQADISTLEERTEGWIAGLQLAAIAMMGTQPGQSPLSDHDPARRSSFIATLSGSHRFILNYLTEEVLSQQPEEIQQFLLQTSILDKLNGDLCNAVTGRSDGRALLERLLNANLFLIPLDEAGHWYRYHQLFADLLRSVHGTHQQAETARLHQRASHWYAQAGGERGLFVHEAIHHALAAQDYVMAVDLLERHAMDMIMQGYAKTVNGWVQAMPAEWASSSPRTKLAFAWMHLLRGAYAQASPYLARAQAAFAGSQAAPHLGEAERSLRAEWLVMRALMLNMHGKVTESKATIIQALELAPEEDSRVRSLAYFGLASACQALEEIQRAVDAYQMAIQYGRAAENLVTEMMSTSGLAQLAFERGRLHLAAEIAGPVSVELEESGSPPPISTVVYGILGEVYYQWLRIEEARRHSLRALQLSTLGGYNSGLISLRVLQSRLSQLEGDLEDAALEMQKAHDLMQVDTPAYVRQEAVAQQVRLYLARNRPAAAEMALQGQGFSFQDRFSAPDLPPGESIPHSTGLLYNSSLRFLLYRAGVKGDRTALRPGIELADRLIARASQGQHLLVAIEALLLRAQMYAALETGESNLAASRADIVRALELAGPEGIVVTFVEQGPPMAEALSSLVKQDQLGAVPPAYVERILHAIAGSHSPGTMHPVQPAAPVPAGIEPDAMIEPLTERELEVLRLMAEGLKYKEIAERLFISLNTVRSHVKAIYGKLNVNNRTQAIEMARQRRIM